MKRPPAIVPTLNDMRAAFLRTELPSRGWSFEKAMDNPAIRQLLFNGALAHRLHEKQGAKKKRKSYPDERQPLTPRLI